MNENECRHHICMLHAALNFLSVLPRLMSCKFSFKFSDFRIDLYWLKIMFRSRWFLAFIIIPSPLRPCFLNGCRQSKLISSLVHEAEESVEVNLVVLAASDYLIDNGLHVLENLDVRNITLRNRFSICLSWVLYDILWHIKKSLQVS